MPGGVALTGPAKVGRIRRSRHPAECDTYLNPYALPAIIHANKRFIYQTLPRRANDAEGFFYTYFLRSTTARRGHIHEHFRSSIR
ncbi:hypothetical protein DMR83_06185 [Klebsiella variicola]|nr:hypothetical protein DMR83_06185 [Klebsiella variicola]